MDQRALFDVEDETSMPPVRDMRVGPVSVAEVEEFAHRYHYTGSAPNFPWRWGLWHGVILHGVVAYNLPTRSTCESVFGPEHYEHVWHMGRLVVSNDSPRNSESRLIGGSLRLIRRQHPHVWAVLTYAATDVGHLGYVYQATNAIYTGTGGHAAYYVDEGGRRHSDYLRGRQVTSSRAHDLGWERRDGGPKHRYLYVLGTPKQRRARMELLRLPNLPYPKVTIRDGAA